MMVYAGERRRGRYRAVVCTEMCIVAEAINIFPFISAHNVIVTVLNIVTLQFECDGVCELSDEHKKYVGKLIE